MTKSPPLTWALFKPPSTLGHTKIEAHGKRPETGTYFRVRPLVPSSISFFTGSRSFCFSTRTCFLYFLFRPFFLFPSLLLTSAVQQTLTDTFHVRVGHDHFGGAVCRACRWGFAFRGKGVGPVDTIMGLLVAAISGELERCYKAGARTHG